VLLVIKQQRQQTEIRVCHGHSVVNMSKSCWFVAVICLPVILFALEADAHETTTPCSSATLELRLVSSSNQQQNAGGGQIRIKEGCAETNETSRLEEVANIVRMIASNQQENVKEIKDQIRDQIEDVKTLLVAPNPINCDAAQLAKQTLVCEYLPILGRAGNISIGYWPIIRECAKYCRERVCLSVYSLPYLGNQT